MQVVCPIEASHAQQSLPPSPSGLVHFESAGGFVRSAFWEQVLSGGWVISSRCFATRSLTTGVDGCTSTNGWQQQVGSSGEAVVGAVEGHEEELSHAAQSATAQAARLVFHAVVMVDVVVVVIVIFSASFFSSIRMWLSKVTTLAFETMFMDGMSLSQVLICSPKAGACTRV